MATLWLLRHAKSSWDDDSQEDHERTLAPRGRRACEVLRKHCAQRVQAERVVCSPATRARQTLERVFPELSADRVRFEPEVYEASLEALVRSIERHAQGVNSLLLVGHNPGLQELALWLTAKTDGTERGLLARLEAKVPTGALITLELDDLTHLKPKSARLVDFVKPKKLASR